jgi:type VI secretion system protein ImpF
MAGLPSDRRVVPGLLDRLIDDEPETTVEPPWREGQIVRELKKSLRRDLEDLLNSRRPLDDLPAGFEELPGSLANYGLPDLQSLEVRETHDLQRLCRLIEDCIRRFEPRLRNVTVAPLVEPGQERPLDRRLRFEIDALLVVDPLREPVQLTSAVDAGSGAILVEGKG